MVRKAGFKVNITPDTDSLVWNKLIINAAINPLTAILGVTNGELLIRPSAHALMSICVQEAANVAQALNIQLPYPNPIQQVETVARDTANNYSSMLQDVRRGAPTEIDAINGEIVHLGTRLRVPTPVNQTLWQLVKALPGVKR